VIEMKVKSTDGLSERTQTGERDQKLKKACQEFDSVLTYELLKSMRRTVEKCDLFHGGSGEEIYESLLDQELAKAMSQSDANSLASILYQQLRDRKASPLRREVAGEVVVGKGTGAKGSPAWPLQATVSSAFGWRKDPLNNEKRFHYGVDLAANQGSTVRASLAGRVVVSDYQEGYGNMVILDHGQGYTTLYAHNEENLVNQGDWVRQGGPLAKVGSTGRSTGPHLHFEVRKNGKHMDPIAFLGKGEGS